MKKFLRSRALLVLLALSLAAGSLFAEGAKDSRPWYAAGLENLGFTVFEKPQAVPDFSLRSLDGNSKPFSAFRGKIVLLNFWATWCPPCRAEMPALDALWKKDKDKAFAILGVSLGEDPKKVGDFIAQNDYSYPIFVDRDSELGSRFGARSIPTTYVFDKDGRAIAGKVGGAEYDSAESIELFAQMAAR